MTLGVAHDGAIRACGQPGTALILHGIQTVCPILGARLALPVLVALVATDGAVQGVTAGTRRVLAAGLSWDRGAHRGRVTPRPGLSRREELA
jgi:hypothetical protein